MEMEIAGEAAPGATFVQVPTYQELDNLKVLVPMLLALPGDLRVLVIDDASPDGTAEWLRAYRAGDPRLHYLLRPGKLGYGTATVAGFRHIQSRGGAAVVTLDADLSHDPAEIPAMLDLLGRYEVVLGSRYIGGCRILNWALKRFILSVGANLYVKTLLRLPYADCTSGFRAYRLRSLLAGVDLELLKSDGYSLLVEILYRLHRGGHSIVEHPVIYSERREGQSKMSRKVIAEAVFNPFRFWWKIGLPGPAPRRGPGR